MLLVKETTSKSGLCAATLARAATLGTVALLAGAAAAGARRKAAEQPRQSPFQGSVKRNGVSSLANREDANHYLLVMEIDRHPADTEPTPFTAQAAFALAQRLLSASENQTLHNVRILRRARQWPTIGKGNQAFPRAAAPFVNVCLAHAAGAPAEAAANVTMLRGLRARGFHFVNGRMEVLDGYLDTPRDLNGVCVFPTLGESLDHFAETGANVAVDILPDRAVPMARLTYSPSPTTYYALPFQGSGPAQPRKPITKSARLEPDMFRAIFETLGAVAPASKGSTWQSAPDESAAPGRAAQSDQCRSTDDTGVRDKPHHTARERKTQPRGASVRRPGAFSKERHHDHVTTSTTRG